MKKKPSEIIIEKIAAKGGRVSSRQIQSILEFLDEYLVDFEVERICINCKKK